MFVRMELERIAMDWRDASILCVIDFTDASKDALQEAIKIAGALKLRLTVLYPYRLNQPVKVPDRALWKKSIEQDATESFTRMTSNLFKETNVLWDFKPEIGFLDDRVEVYTETHAVRLVVMSSELACKSGDTFCDILESLTTPLLIVPKKKNQKL